MSNTETKPTRAEQKFDDAGIARSLSAARPRLPVCRLDLTFRRAILIAASSYPFRLGSYPVAGLRATTRSTERIPPSSSPSSWRNAYDKGLVGIRSAWLTSIVALADGTWTGRVLWKTGTTSKGVTEVKYGNCKLSLSVDGKTLFIDSEDPFEPGARSSGQLTKISDELHDIPNMVP